MSLRCPSASGSKGHKHPSQTPHLQTQPFQAGSPGIYLELKHGTQWNENWLLSTMVSTFEGASGGSG